MADVIDILKSGPIPLDELNRRTSASPEDLLINLEQLKKLGLVNVAGPKKAIRELTPENAPDVVIELTNSAMRRLLRGEQF
jgi:hypothetical protein